MRLKTLIKMKVLSVLLVCLGIFSSNAQTTLSAGDIMFVGVNSDDAGSPAADEFVVLFLEPVSSGTVIYFTDMGYTGNSAPYFQQNPNNGCAASTGAVSDGMISWTATSAVSAGTQLVIRVKPATGSISASTGSLSIEVQSSIVGAGMDLSAAGEAIHAFQGTLNGSNQVTSATMLASLDFDAVWTGTVTTCEFTSTRSEDPGTGYEVEFSSHDDNGYYNGSLTGSKSALQSAILNSSNWTKSSSTTYTFPIVPPSTTWNGSTWSNGTPNASMDAIIASTTTAGSFTCNNLTINSGGAVVFGTNDVVNINGDVTNNGFGFVAVDNTGNLNFASSSSLSGNANSFVGVVTVASGATLTTNNLLTLTSNSSYTGSIGASAGTISGNVNIQRHLSAKRAFRFFAHPFTTAQPFSILTDDIDITGSGGSTNGFTNTTTNNPSAYLWDESSADNTTAGNNPGWSAVTSASSNIWAKGALARVLVRGSKGQGLTGGSYTPSTATLDMTGVVNQGTQVITLTKGSGSNFVACGNPFPSPVQMNAVTRGSNIGSSYYVWDATSGTRGAYVTNAFTTSYILPAYAAFFTTASANSNNTITFEEADKTGSTPADVFKTTAATDWVEFLIEDSNTRWDRFLFHYDNNAQASEDYYDAVKLNNPSLDFFTYSSNDEALAIDSRPYKDGEVIQLGLTAYTNYGKYVIRTGDVDIPAGTKLYFHDNYLNKTIEVKAGFEYWFDITSDVNTQGKRFQLNTSGVPTSVATVAENGAKVQLVPNPAKNVVNVSYENVSSDATIRLVDITGKILFSEKVNTPSGVVALTIDDLANGIYIVQLEGQGISVVEKLIKE